MSAHEDAVDAIAVQMAGAVIDALIRRHPGIASVIDGIGVVVPMEPTADQFVAGSASIQRQGGLSASRIVDCEAVYRAMVKAGEVKP